jgi:hypothetical protein
LHRLEFNFELNLTAARNCSQDPPVSTLASPASCDRAPPARAFWLQAGVDHPAPPDHCAGPPRPSPAPPRCVAASYRLAPFSSTPLAAPLKGCCHHRHAHFLSLSRPRPFSSETEPPSIPLASCPPRPPAPSPFHREIEAAATASTPHGELPPSTIVVLCHGPLLTTHPTLVLQDPPKLTADHWSPTPP